MKRHVYDGERCIHCGVNVYDQIIYGVEDESDCTEREPMVHTSETAPQDPHLDPEKRAALRAFADGLPAKKVVLDDTAWAEVFDTVADFDGDEPQVRNGNRGGGGWQCTCGRFARFIRWQNTGAPGWERGYLVNCKRCGEVLVF